MNKTVSDKTAAIDKTWLTAKARMMKKTRTLTKTGITLLSALLISSTSYALQIQENETGFCGVDAGSVISTTNAGYTGAGYIDLENAANEGVDYKVNAASAGSYNMTVRHAGNNSSGIHLIINGVSSGQTLPTTANYSTWTSTVIVITLAAGINTVRIQASGNSARPNIDYVEFSGSTSAVYCGFNIANTCAAAFPSALANSHSNGSIVLNYFTNVINAPSNTLTTLALTKDANATNCNGVACSKSNSLADPLSSPTFNGGSNVTSNYQQTVNLTPGQYGSFNSGTESITNFAPGAYFFNGNFDVGYASKLNISADGTVQIYVSGAAVFNTNSINTINPSANKRLFFYSVGNITFNFQTKVRAIVYSEANIDINDQVQIEGAVAAKGIINAKYQTVITYNSPLVSATDIGSSCAPLLDHFTISTAATGSTCLAHSVTITAADASNNTLTNYVGTINLSTTKNRGNWYYTGITANAEGTLTPGSNDSGLATYTFVGNDAGTATLSIVDGHAGTNSIKVTDTSASVTSTSINIAFSENAFVVTSTDTLGSDVIAGRDHQFHVDMIKKDPTTGSCGPAIRYNVANVKVWITRAANDPNGTAPAIKNAANTDTESLPNAAPGSANFTANFVSGSADFSLITSDVGRYTINFSDTSNSFADYTITGASANFTARPFGFDITTTANPAATTAAGGTFKKAGENFPVTVRAVAWQSSDDFNVDGIPDFHTNANLTDDVNLSNNATLASFGKESPAEGVSLTSSLFLPSGGNNPGLTGTPTLTGFVGGSASTTLAFNEVGIIALKASLTDGDYLNAGAAPTTKMLSGSRTIGRFYPAQFNLASGSVDASCTSGVDYSYIAENFGTNLQLNAVSTNGSITTNYQGDFAKLSSANLGSSFAAADLGLPTALTARLNNAINNFTWNAGVLTTDATLSIDRAATPEAPLTQTAIGIAPIDSDGVSLASAALDLDSDNNSTNETKSLGLTTLRHGRVRLKSAHGPETTDLPVEFVTEYWNGSEWLMNTDDSCTTIALTDIAYPDGTLDTLGNRTIALGLGTTTGHYGNLGGGAVNFVNGDAGHYFSAPGSGHTGSFNVDVDLTNYPWLQFDWNNDGNHAESALPTTHFSFGSYRGHDRILFWQEVWN